MSDTHTNYYNILKLVNLINSLLDSDEGWDYDSLSGDDKIIIKDLLSELLKHKKLN